MAYRADSYSLTTVDTTQTSVVPVEQGIPAARSRGRAILEGIAAMLNLLAAGLFYSVLLMSIMFSLYHLPSALIWIMRSIWVMLGLSPPAA